MADKYPEECLPDPELEHQVFRKCESGVFVPLCESGVSDRIKTSFRLALAKLHVSDRHPLYPTLIERSEHLYSVTSKRPEWRGSKILRACVIAAVLADLGFPHSIRDVCFVCDIRCSHRIRLVVEQLRQTTTALAPIDFIEHFCDLVKIPLFDVFTQCDTLCRGFFSRVGMFRERSFGLAVLLVAVEYSKNPMLRGHRSKLEEVKIKICIMFGLYQKQVESIVYAIKQLLYLVLQDALGPVPLQNSDDPLFAFFDVALMILDAAISCESSLIDSTFPSSSSPSPSSSASSSASE